MADPFSDSTQATVLFKGIKPLFLSAERDQGAALIWDSPTGQAQKVRLTAALFNGEGRGASGSRNQNNTLDMVLRGALSGLRGRLEVGASYYNGASVVPVTSAAGAALINARREFGGIDIRYQAPFKTLLKAEYIGGTFEETPDRSAFLKGNHIAGYLLSAVHPLSARWDIATRYEEFAPVMRAYTIGEKSFGRSELTRQIFHLGFSYKIDSATKARLWYSKALTSYDPVGASGSDRLSLISGEIQIIY